MKKFRSGIIALILCIISSFTVFAAQGTISFSDPSVTVGEEVNVTMKVGASDGAAIGKSKVSLTYPASDLEFISGTDANGGAGAVVVNGTSNGGGSSEVSYNLKFKTVSAGTFNIGIEYADVEDTDGQGIEFTHLGSSAITVNAPENASADCTLSSLDVYPGTLEPAFSADNTEYSITVGLGVTKLTINALSTDGSANVQISNNDDLPDGESTVVVTVNAPDGSANLAYNIHVNKVEGGAESTITEAGVELSDGVQLSSKGKTITIMNPSEDVEIPEGFKQGTISIDDQKVQGWVWGAAESPEYCVVYGMNDKGEINFYRYDMVEKTIQRYFEDPLAANAVSNAEYSELMEQKDAALRSAETRLIIMVVIAVLAFAAIMACVYLWFRLQTSERMQKTYRKQSMDRYRSNTSSEEEDSDIRIDRESSDEIIETDILKHDFSNAEEASEEEDIGETQVIRRPERKRRVRRSYEESQSSFEDLDDLDSDTSEDETKED